MDIENAKSWAAQPDVCRCCLSTSGAWDLTVSYHKNGVKEVFGDMILESFGISITHLSEWGPSRMVCDLCVEHIRSTTSFKRQVLEAEKTFTEYVEEKNKAIPKPMKIEVEEYFDDATSVDTETEHCETESRIEKKCGKKKSTSKFKFHKILKATRKHIDTNKEKIPNGPGIQKNLPDLLLLDLRTEKPLSDRKKMSITCETIINCTTACPFRHHKSFFQCLFCNDEFTDMRELKRHCTAHTLKEKQMTTHPKTLQIDISKVECTICDVTLDDVDSLCAHLATHNKMIFKECIADYKVTVSPFVCHLCNKDFHVFRTLTMHLNDHYANFVCDECGKSFLNSKRLKVHKRTHETGEFPCKECGKVLRSRTAVANHAEWHSNRVLKCQICSASMKHYNDRIKHMSEVHNVTHTFKCSLCPKEYNIKHYLATHVRQTHGVKDKKCPECNMAFITNHSLKKHMTKHTGAKPYTCHICTKPYARAYTLKEHMKTHNEKLEAKSII